MVRIPVEHATVRRLVLVVAGVPVAVLRYVPRPGASPIWLLPGKVMGG